MEFFSRVFCPEAASSSIEKVIDLLAEEKYVKAGELAQSALDVGFFNKPEDRIFFNIIAGTGILHEYSRIPDEKDPLMLIRALEFFGAASALACGDSWMQCELLIAYVCFMQGYTKKARARLSQVNSSLTLRETEGALRYLREEVNTLFNFIDNKESIPNQPKLPKLRWANLVPLKF